MLPLVAVVAVILRSQTVAVDALTIIIAVAVAAVDADIIAVVAGIKSLILNSKIKPICHSAIGLTMTKGSVRTPLIWLLSILINFVYSTICNQFKLVVVVYS